MRNLCLPTALALLALGSVGCETIAIVDDVDLTLDFSPLTGPSDDLHTPYVVGSSMSLYARSSDHHHSLTGWTLESSDASVMQLSFTRNDSGRLLVDAKAVGEGTATLVVKDEHGRGVVRQVVDVKRPDRIDLLAHGYLIIQRPEEARIPQPHVLTGGTATFLARYYAGAAQLNGNGALSVMPSTGLGASVKKTYLFEDRDWLQLNPVNPGTLTLPLLIAGQKVSDLTIESVDPSTVQSLRVLGVDESRANTGDALTALAQAYDATGGPIFGVAFKWELDGLDQTGLGDLYRYRYEPRDLHALCARFGALDAVATIHGKGFVDSTNHVGCQAAPGGAGGAPLGAGLVLAAAWALVSARRGAARRSAP